jgi:hypothetical protein
VKKKGFCELLVASHKVLSQITPVRQCDFLIDDEEVVK